MNKIIYITLEAALVTHKKTIDHSGGGTYEHINPKQLGSVLEHIQNDDYYPTFVDKITHLFSRHVNFIALLMVIKELQ